MTIKTIIALAAVAFSMSGCPFHCSGPSTQAAQVVSK